MKVKPAIRAVAEAAGLAVSVSLSDATTQAEQRRADLTATKSRVDEARAAVDAAHDRGASASELEKLEAAVDDANMTAERAQLAYQAAERRLVSAEQSEAAKGKAEMQTRLAVVANRRVALGRIIDDASNQIADARREIESQARVIGEAVSARVVGREALNLVRASRLVELALQKAGAIEGAWIGDPANRPGAVELTERDRDILTNRKD